MTFVSVQFMFFVCPNISNKGFCYTQSYNGRHLVGFLTGGPTI